MLAQGLIAALVLSASITAQPQSEPSEPFFDIETIYDLNGDLEGRAFAGQEDLYYA